MPLDPIQELYAIVDARRWDELDHVFHPDVVYARPGYSPFVGLSRVRQFYEHERIIGSGIHHVISSLKVGDEGSSCGRFVGCDRQGAPLEEPFAEFFQFRNGKIVARTTYFFRAAI